jgi:hypothetical protein
MICPNKASKDFDLEDCIGCEYYSQCLTQSGLGNQGDNFPKMNKDLPDFIQDGICKKDNQTYCNLGYACDGCPYNPDNNKKDMDKINNKTPITKEELDKFKIEMGEILFFSDWEKKINE